jgi:type I restriction enzyme S subunit
MIEQRMPNFLSLALEQPDDWKTIKFRQVFSFRKGLNITKENLTDEGIPVISYGQVHSKTNKGTGINDDLIRYVSENYLRTNTQSLVKYNDFIFADTSEDLDGVGNCVFVDTNRDIFAGYHSIITRPIIDNSFPKYFAYLFLTEFWRSQLRSSVMGVKVFSITQKLLRDTFVIVPTYTDQKAIANFLDKQCGQIDSIISDIENQIEVLQKYRKSLITETVTKGLDKSVSMKDSGIGWIGKIPEHWEIKKLKYISDIHSSRRIFEEEYQDEGIPFFRTKEISELSNNKDISLELYISEKRYNCLKRSAPKRNDLLISSIGTIGEVWVSDGRKFYYKDGNITQIDGNYKFESMYVSYVIKSDIFIKAIEYYESTTTISALTIEKIKRIMVPICSLKEQRDIVSFLNSKCQTIEEIITKKQNQLETIKQHKISLIYEYVTGKKRVSEVEANGY